MFPVNTQAASDETTNHVVILDVITHTTNTPTNDETLLIRDEHNLGVAIMADLSEFSIVETPWEIQGAADDYMFAISLIADRLTKWRKSAAITSLITNTDKNERLEVREDHRRAISILADLVEFAVIDLPFENSQASEDFTFAIGLVAARLTKWRV